MYFKIILEIIQMKILVTGANGLLGHHVVMELLRQQHSVSIIVRNLSNIYFDLKMVNVTVGNFCNLDDLMKAAQGCEAIIHIAALTSTHLLHYSDYEIINVEGSKTIINVANKLNINRLIYVSTSNTVGYNNDGISVQEKMPIQFPFSKSFYARSKVEAEKLFMELSEQANKQVIIINPTFMIGAWDVKPSSGKLMLMGYKKPILFIPSGGKNFVAASYVASVISKSLDMNLNAEKFIVSGVNLSFRHFYEKQKSIGNYSQRIIVLPNTLLRIIAGIGDLIRYLGIKTDLCSMNINQLLIQENYSNTKQEKHIKIPQQPLEQAIDEALNWFIKRGKIN